MVGVLVMTSMMLRNLETLQHRFQCSQSNLSNAFCDQACRSQIFSPAYGTGSWYVLWYQSMIIIMDLKDLYRVLSTRYSLTTCLAHKSYNWNASCITTVEVGCNLSSQLTQNAQVTAYVYTSEWFGMRSKPWAWPIISEKWFIMELVRSWYFTYKNFCVLTLTLLRFWHYWDMVQNGCIKLN